MTKPRIGKQRDKQLLDKERIDKQRRKPLYGSNSQATTNVARQGR